MTIIETNLSFNSNHSNRKGNPPAIVLHHAASNGSVEQIHNGHKSRGYAGIGYHFYVRKDGKIYRGRPEEWVGAHAEGYNNMLGICAEGNFQNDTMGAAQRNSIVELICYLFGKYGKLKIYGHRDLMGTACPGKNYPFDTIVAAANNGGTVIPEEDDGYTLEEFVRELQAAIGAEVDGVPGEETIHKTPTLSAAKNTRHAAVKPVQKRLAALGYTQVGEADGIAGSKFKAAVAALQEDTGCYKDGELAEWGKSWQKLLEMV